MNRFYVCFFGILHHGIQEVFMTSEDALKQYSDWKFRLSAYEMAISIINIDKMTVAPQAGAAFRDERTAFLSGEAFAIQNDPKILPVLQLILKEEPEDSFLRKEAELYLKEIMKIQAVPKDEYVAFKKAADASYDAWLEAKTSADYSVFRPHLEGMIAWQKKLYGYRSSSLPLYDQMLDEYEPGTNTAFYDRFFNRLKERILPLIKRVNDAAKIEDAFLFQSCPVDIQKAWVHNTLLPYLGFDPSWGYQNETEHPFTSWTCENDCRTTTKYLENNLVSTVYSTVHEVGHAWYEHNIDPRFDGTILSSGVSSGMHESQSRFCENYLARSLPFWQANYKSLQNAFPAQLGGIPVEQFVRAVNASHPSLIRTEADELTYPIHILIRYEIEKGMFDGTIPCEELETVWNQKYYEYLGVAVPDAASGILQDVHWSDGSFGYFPTYALGSAFAAQFYRKMRSEMDVDEALRNGRYTDCIDWLKTHIHRHGARYNADEIMKMATGESFNPDYYLDYLEQKFSDLYGLQ